MEKKFDVYGIGNALVDIEFEVTDEFIKTAEINKGQMTLVDEARQHQIVSTLHGSHHKKSSGGSAANTIIGCAQFGGKAFYSCKVGNDEYGEFYFRDLRENGVETNLTNETLEAGTTGKCIVLLSPDGERTMNTFLGISSQISVRELVEDEIKNSKYLYIEGYLVASPTGKDAAIQAKKIAEAHGVKTAITLSDVNIVKYFTEGFKEIIGSGVDLLFCNESEAHAYTGTEDIKEAANILKTVAKTFAITLGSKGALVYDGHEEHIIPTIKVKAIDTNGAGDLFAGALLYGITNGLSWPEAGKLGCLASAKLVTQFGARLQHDQALAIKNSL
jgi:sugar/nucleoside kinase (ribokinase family)